MTINLKSEINKLLDGMTVGDRYRVLKFCQTISAMRSGKKAARVGSHQRRSPVIEDWRVGK